MNINAPHLFSRAIWEKASLETKLKPLITVLVGTIALSVLLYYTISYYWSRRREDNLLDTHSVDIQVSPKNSKVAEDILFPSPLIKKNLTPSSPSDSDTTSKKEEKLQKAGAPFHWKAKHLILESKDSIFKRQLFIKTLNGKTLTISLPNHATVKDFVTAVATAAHIPVNQVRIIFAGKEISSQENLSRHLDEFNLYKENASHLVIRLPDNIHLLLDPILQNICAQNDNFICDNTQILDASVMSVVDRVYRDKLDNDPIGQLETFTQLINEAKSQVQQSQDQQQRDNTLLYLDNIVMMIQCCQKWHQESIHKLPVLKQIETLVSEKLEENPALICAPITGQEEINLVSPEGKKVSLDRAALFKQSDYLQTYFKYSNSQHFKINNSSSSEYQFSEDKINEVIFDTLIEFLLTGQTTSLSSLEENDLIGLYMQADLLQLHHLEALCAKQIIGKYINNEWEEQDFIDTYRDHPTLLGTILQFI